MKVEGWWCGEMTVKSRVNVINKNGLHVHLTWFGTTGRFSVVSFGSTIIYDEGDMYDADGFILIDEISFEGDNATLMDKCLYNILIEKPESVNRSTMLIVINKPESYFEDIAFTKINANIDGIRTVTYAQLCENDEYTRS